MRKQHWIVEEMRCKMKMVKCKRRKKLWRKIDRVFWKLIKVENQEKAIVTGMCIRKNAERIHEQGDIESEEVVRKGWSAEKISDIDGIRKLSEMLKYGEHVMTGCTPSVGWPGERRKYIPEVDKSSGSCSIHKKKKIKRAWGVSSLSILSKAEL